MLATIILDAFKLTEARDIASALDDLCSPKDTYAFSSACIYAFWSVPEHEILYVGLAKDIARRFRQHTGLLSCKESSCKREQIYKYFESKQRLGFSIFVQSSLDQPMTKDDEEVVAESIDSELCAQDLKDIFESEKNIKHAEGMLLELHNQLGDRLPEWNKIHGSSDGRKKNSISDHAAVLHLVNMSLLGKSPEEMYEYLNKDLPFHLLLNMDGSEVSDFTARSTLRELSNNIAWGEHELLLHGVRILSIDGLVTFEQGISIQEARNSEAGPRFARMKRDGYWDKKVVLPQ